MECHKTAKYNSCLKALKSRQAMKHWNRLCELDKALKAEIPRHHSEETQEMRDKKIEEHKKLIEHGYSVDSPPHPKVFKVALHLNDDCSYTGEVIGVYNANDVNGNPIESVTIETDIGDEIAIMLDEILFVKLLNVEPKATE